MIKVNACAEQYRPSPLNAGLLALILLITTLFVSPHVNAASTNGGYNMILNGRSIHLSAPPNGKKFNENNYGSGLQYDFGHTYGSKWITYATSSAFSDSFNNLSYYAGGGQARRFHIKNGWHADVGYVGFMMARKDFNNYKPFPGVLPIASIGTRNVALNVTYVPPVRQGLAELIFFQLKISTDGW